jgi:hypothetical protein
VTATLKEKVPENAKPKEAAEAALSVGAELTEQKAAGASLTDKRISELVNQHTDDLPTAN